MKFIRSLLLTLASLFVINACETQARNISVLQTPQLPATLAETIQVPKGKYLFVEYWVKENGYGSCSPKNIDGPFYGRITQDGFLSLNSCDVNPPYFSSDYGLKGHAALTENTTVLLGMGREYCGNNWSGVYDVMYPLDKWPYSILQSDKEKSPFSVLANTEVVVDGIIKEDGTIKAKMGDEDFVLEPNQSWIYAVHDNPENSCRRTITYSFTNYGLIDREKVHFSP